jgi:hypothetical protein
MLTHEVRIISEAHVQALNALAPGFADQAARVAARHVQSINRFGSDKIRSPDSQIVKSITHNSASA